MSQWFIGIRSGINFTGAQASQYHSEFSSVNQQDNIAESSLKTYGKLSSNIGTQIGLSATFAPHPNIFISARPIFLRANYSYTNELNWFDEDNPNNSLALFYDHEQSLSYLEIPLVVRYNFGRQKIKPFVQGGGFYGRLLQAGKSVKTSGIDKASGGTNEFDNGTQSTEVTSLYLKSQVGVMTGGGIACNLGGIMLSLDANLKMGMNNVVNTKERYSATRELSGFGNVLDDVTLKNIEVSFTIQFPLKFLTKSFEPIIL